jgi:hypothetical protein
MEKQLRHGIAEGAARSAIRTTANRSQNRYGSGDHPHRNAHK